MLMEKIRYIKENEYYLLEDFLYEAIFIPEEIEPPPRDIIQKEELQVYIIVLWLKLTAGSSARYGQG